MDNTFKRFFTIFLTALFVLAATGLTACGGDSAKVSEPTPSDKGASAPATVIPATPLTLFVGNTDGAGVFLRGSPNGNERIKAWPEGTAMTVVGQD
ncbi:MAG: hypothetical protein Q7O66_09770, partial [Dehalococcoidia bacterium]|nr:hypothetical protein [Dehalococcoidia bacterium]